MKRLPSILFWLIALAIVWPIFKPVFQKTDSPVDRLGQLPVLEEGRIKPLDSVARHNLLQLRGKQSIRTDSGKVSAIEWLTDLLLNREAAHSLPVFRIDHPNIVGLLGHEPGTRKYFSYEEMEPHLPRIQDQARSVDPDTSQWSAYERAINQLFGNLIQYQILTQTVYPLGLRGSVGSFYHTAADSLHQAGEAMASTGTGPTAAAALRRQIRQVEDMVQSPLFLLHKDGEWLNPGQVLQQTGALNGDVPPVLHSLANLAGMRRSADTEGFATQVEALHSMAPETIEDNPGTEFYFNQSQPFIVSLILYVFIILLVFLGWQFSPRIFLGPAYGILILALAVHTYGLILRVIITGYAPVTNLYSSAVFVGWVAVILSAVFEFFQRKGVGSLAAATVGFLSLLVAHHLGDSGDTMEKMRAVLNSNFWLSTHVITITMGYGATFLAGFLGIIYMLYAWFRRGLSKEMQKSFHRMIFGATCFSLLFSFVGTVLGGIWADQSWGRFWGWDPKENGALMIVLWTTMMIHALRCGMIRTRGLVNLAIGANIITAWSWFGTNMLGVGLHSYGFMDSAFFWLVLFWISQFAFIAAEGLFPVRVKPVS
ncbi:MAG TPA: cytochrome c biogenesis protein CcsA [Oceanipulchritudo sp.]|nr:cytochrome c biogenesis protein CcsA [Oceanipulchritudo sp.]